MSSWLSPLRSSRALKPPGQIRFGAASERQPYSYPCFIWFLSQHCLSICSNFISAAFAFLTCELLKWNIRSDFVNVCYTLLKADICVSFFKHQYYFTISSSWKGMCPYWIIILLYPLSFISVFFSLSGWWRKLTENLKFEKQLNVAMCVHKCRRGCLSPSASVFSPAILLWLRQSSCH